MKVLLLSLVWGWSAVMFQLSGLYCSPGPQVLYHPEQYHPEPQIRTKYALIKGHPELVWPCFWVQMKTKHGFT